MRPVPGNSGGVSSKGSSRLSTWRSGLPSIFIFSWLWAMPVACLLGGGVIVVYALQFPNAQRWSVFGTAVAIGASAYFAGGLVGFLFGIPRTGQVPASSKRSAPYQANTNLEQVSDWLTKIIVGIGLVQVGHLVPALSKLAASMKAPLGGQASSGAFGLGGGNQLRSSRILLFLSMEPFAIRPGTGTR